jgi:hypothetical protein
MEVISCCNKAGEEVDAIRAALKAKTWPVKRSGREEARQETARKKWIATGIRQILLA